MVNMYGQEKKLLCENCGKDILVSDPERGPGIIVMIEDKQGVTFDVYPSCKGPCDSALKSQRSKNGLDGWRDVTDFTNPLLFAKYTFAGINLAFDKKFTPAALDQYKQVLIAAFQHVLREPTDAERSQVQLENMLPF